MQRYEPKPWDIRRCSMVRDEQGEYVRYDDAQATIALLTAELEAEKAKRADAVDAETRACAEVVSQHGWTLTVDESTAATIARLDQRKESRP